MSKRLPIAIYAVASMLAEYFFGDHGLRHRLIARTFERASKALDEGCRRCRYTVMQRRRCVGESPGESQGSASSPYIVEIGGVAGSGCHRFSQKALLNVIFIAPEPRSSISALLEFKWCSRHLVSEDARSRVWCTS